jgi:ADP-Ribosyltransferase in polyvalent proteins
MKFKQWLIIESIMELTLYHGTNADFDEFQENPKRMNTDYGYYGYGIYLSSNPRYAKYYGHKIYKCHVTLNNPLIWEKGKEELAEKYEIKGYPKNEISAAKELTQKIKDDGYDSVIVLGEGTGMIYGRMVEVLVFNPSQIKIINKEPNQDIEYSDFINKVRNPIL